LSGYQHPIKTPGEIFLHKNKFIINLGTELFLEFLKESEVGIIGRKKFFNIEFEPEVAKWDKTQQGDRQDTVDNPPAVFSIHSSPEIYINYPYSRTALL
jgi:hypothetical protein